MQVPEGRADLHPADGRREPPHRRVQPPGPGRQGADPGAGPRAVPDPARPAPPARRPALGGPAADARHRAGADGRRRGCCCSTSRRSGSHRRWSPRSARSSGRSTQQGTAVLLVEQNATMALRVAAHAVVLTVGEVSLAGTAAELARRRARPRPVPRRRRAAPAVDGGPAAWPATAPAGRSWAGGLGHGARRADGATAGLEIDAVTVRFAGVTALDQVSLAGRAGVDPRGHRAQRRRQVDAVQRRVRRLPAGARLGAVRRPRAGRAGGPTRSPASAWPAPSRTSPCTRTPRSRRTCCSAGTT